MKFTKSALALALLMLPTSSLADKKAPSKRDCELKTKGNDKVDFECKTKSENETTEFKDKIEFKISTDKDRGLKVKVEYEEETELKRRRLNAARQLQTVEEREIETSYEVVFDKIIEYRKPAATAGRRRLTAAEEAYDWETDVIVSEIAFGSWTGFSDIQVNQRRRRLQGDGNVTDTPDEGEDDTVYTFSLSSADGVATFDFTIAQAGNQAASATANKMQIDIRLTDYPYAEDGTNVALLTSVESEREVDIEYADEESGDSADASQDDGDQEDRVSDEEMGDEEDQVDADGDDGDEDGRRRRLSARESSEVKISFDDAVAATGIRPFGEFTWAKDATVTTSNTTSTNTTTDEQSEPVVAVMATTSDQNETTEETMTIQVVATSDGKNRLAFSFVGGAVAQNAPDIYWDPETGVSYAEGGINGSSAVDMAWKGGMALVAAAAVLMW
uniref:Uncharacterized protein n=1 Tax=Amphora coffeiformis TaxID=265554 RepID=A0A7S3L3H4_9STRA|eukprot:scaffold19245_cov199-Amphora_coffeaeformis.AAC.36